MKRYSVSGQVFRTIVSIEGYKQIYNMHLYWRLRSCLFIEKVGVSS